MYLSTTIDNEYKSEFGKSIDGYEFFSNFKEAKRVVKYNVQGNLPYGGKLEEYGTWYENGKSIDASVIYTEFKVRPCDKVLEKLSETEAFSDVCEDETELSMAQMLNLVQDLIDGKPWEDAVDEYGSSVDEDTIAIAITKAFDETGERVPDAIKETMPEVKKFRVVACMRTYPKVDLWATSPEKAMEIADDLDGGEFTVCDYEGDWEIFTAEPLE